MNDNAVTLICSVFHREWSDFQGIGELNNFRKPIDDVAVMKSHDVILNMLSARQECQLYGCKFFINSNDDKLTSRGP